MSADLSGEITAIATAVLAFFAIVTAYYAIRAFRKQSQEVSDQAEMLRVQSDQFAKQRKLNERQTEVLALQAAELRESLEERKRAAADSRSAQASRVYMQELKNPPRGELKPNMHAFVYNRSDQPVYEAELLWHRDSENYGDPDPEPLGTLLPGESPIASRDFPYGTRMAATGAILMFRDAAGVKWIRRPDGGLVEQQ